MAVNQFRIVKWSEFQHYRDRNPPWIKLHYDLLTSRTWIELDDASRLLAVACMLVASRNGGEIPSGEYVRRVAYLDKSPDFRPLVKIGFLQALTDDASAMLADAITMRQNARPETETEAEAEREAEAEAERTHDRAAPSKARKRAPVVRDWREGSFGVLWSFALSIYKGTQSSIGGGPVARKSFDAAGSPDVATLVEALKADAERVRANAAAKRVPDRLPMLSTWLNQGRWTAHEAPPKRGTSGAPWRKSDLVQWEGRTWVRPMCPQGRDRWGFDPHGGGWFEADVPGVSLMMKGRPFDHSETDRAFRPLEDGEVVE